MEQVKDSIYEDDYFSHIFKRIQSEYLVTSDDGEFVDMLCTSWLDIGQEMEKMKEETPVWKTDLSQIRTNEKNHMQPLQPISDELAAQLLLPIKGLCTGVNVDIWTYNLCVGLFVRQEIIVNESSYAKVPESNNIGISNSLFAEQGKVVTELIGQPLVSAQSISDKALSDSGGKEDIKMLDREAKIQRYIQRSRMTRQERFNVKVEPTQEE